MNRRSCALALALALTPALASAAGPGGEAPRIYGGTDVELCGWPSAANLQGNCSATLIHPQVLIYAAHCGSGYQVVRFTEDINQGGGRSVATEYCRTNPVFNDGSLGQGIDFAFCKLAEPVTGVPIVPMLMGCETAILAPGRKATLVGFGVADTGPYGIKREVEVTVNGVGVEAGLGGGGTAGCNGDSGGPAYIRLSSEVNGDDTWRAFGIASYITGECGISPTYYSLMHKGVEWIEGEVGIDITPCHDVDGTWNPGPDCRNFPKEPGTGIGDWQSGCAPGPVGGWSSICGEPYGPPDTTAPTVTITAPASGASFDTGGTGMAQVPIAAEADDSDGFGVQDVRLMINGQEIPNSTDLLAPWEWPANFNVGQYTVVAIARDYGGNEAQSEPVYFGVDMDAPVPPSEEDTGGTGDSDGDSETGEEGGAGHHAPHPKGCDCAAGGGPLGSAFLGLLPLLRRRRRR